MQNVVPIDQNKSSIKKFLDKPLSDATIRDAFIQHAGMVVISVMIPLAFQGGSLLIDKLRGE